MPEHYSVKWTHGTDRVSRISPAEIRMWSSAPLSGSKPVFVFASDRAGEECLSAVMGGRKGIHPVTAEKCGERRELSGIPAAVTLIA